MKDRMDENMVIPKEQIEKFEQQLERKLTKEENYMLSVIINRYEDVLKEILKESEFSPDQRFDSHLFNVNDITRAALGISNTIAF